MKLRQLALGEVCMMRVWRIYYDYSGGEYEPLYVQLEALSVMILPEVGWCRVFHPGGSIMMRVEGDIVRVEHYAGEE